MELYGEMFLRRRKIQSLEETNIYAINKSAPDFAQSRQEIAFAPIGLFYGMGYLTTVSYSGHACLSNYVCVAAPTPGNLS